MIQIRDLCLIGACGLLLTGCPPSESSDDDDWYGESDDDYTADDDDNGDDDDYAGDDDTVQEEEDDFITVPPSVSDIYVFIANPGRDTVSKVQVETRQIDTVEVGGGPSQVLVTPDYNTAVVFNDLDDTLSIVDAQTNEVETVGVREDFNDMVMSPSGEHVLCYLNTALQDDDEPIDGVISYTELSVVDLEGLVSHDFSVGFNPKQIKFADDGDRAIIISDEYITVVELDEDPPIPELIDLEADPFDPPVAAEVEVEPTGEFAFIRYANQNAIQVVDLDSGQLAWVGAGNNPTDMDLSPLGNELMVVSRTSRELRIFSALDPLDAPRLIALPESETVGSLAMAPTGDLAMLYTSATLTDRVTMWDRATDELSIERLEKPVAQVIMAPDGVSVLIVHTLSDAAGEDDVYSDRYVLTILTTTDGAFIPNAVLLEDELASLATFDDGNKALFMMEENRFVGVIDFQTRLVDDIQVPSYPVHVGTMPMGEQLPTPVGWVSQDHSLGRISFLDPDTLQLHTVTGFELNSGIE